jgi:hypothetical protein
VARALSLAEALAIPELRRAISGVASLNRGGTHDRGVPPGVRPTGKANEESAGSKESTHLCQVPMDAMRYSGRDVGAFGRGESRTGMSAHSRGPLAISGSYAELRRVGVRVQALPAFPLRAKRPGRIVREPAD